MQQKSGKSPLRAGSLSALAAAIAVTAAAPTPVAAAEPGFIAGEIDVVGIRAS